MFLQDEQLIPAGILIQRQVIEQVGGYEDRFRGNYEDAVLLAKVCLQFPVYVSSDWGYRYRQHPNSWTKGVIQAGQALATQALYLDWVEQYLIEQDIQEPDVWQTLRQAQWPHRHPWLYRVNVAYRSLFRQLEQGLIHLGSLAATSCGSRVAVAALGQYPLSFTRVG